VLLLVGPNPKPMYDVPMCLHMKMKLGQVSNVQKDDDVALTWEMHKYGLSPISSLVMNLQLLMLFLLESLMNQLIFFTTMSLFFKKKL
jgi:hypothetical protein